MVYPVPYEKAAKNKSIQGQWSWQMGNKIILALNIVCYFGQRIQRPGQKRSILK